MATPHTIAVAGKGGVGKTTTCGMIVDYLCKKKQGPILVVVRCEMTPAFTGGEQQECAGILEYV